MSAVGSPIETECSALDRLLKRVILYRAADKIRKQSECCVKDAALSIPKKKSCGKISRAACEVEIRDAMRQLLLCRCYSGDAKCQVESLTGQCYTKQGNHALSNLMLPNTTKRLWHRLILFFLLSLVLNFNKKKIKKNIRNKTFHSVVLYRMKIGACMLSKGIGTHS